MADEIVQKTINEIFFKVNETSWKKCKNRIQQMQQSYTSCNKALQKMKTSEKSFQACQQKVQRQQIAANKRMTRSQIDAARRVQAVQNTLGQKSYKADMKRMNAFYKAQAKEALKAERAKAKAQAAAAKAAAKTTNADSWRDPDRAAKRMAAYQARLEEQRRRATATGMVGRSTGHNADLYMAQTAAMNRNPNKQKPATEADKAAAKERQRQRLKEQKADMLYNANLIDLQTRLQKQHKGTLADRYKAAKATEKILADERAGLMTAKERMTYQKQINAELDLADKKLKRGIFLRKKQQQTIIMGQKKQRAMMQKGMGALSSGSLKGGMKGIGMALPWAGPMIGLMAGGAVIGALQSNLDSTKEAVSRTIELLQQRKAERDSGVTNLQAVLARYAAAQEGDYNYDVLNAQTTHAINKTDLKNGYWKVNKNTGRYEMLKGGAYSKGLTAVAAERGQAYAEDMRKWLEGSNNMLEVIGTMAGLVKEGYLTEATATKVVGKQNAAAMVGLINDKGENKEYIDSVRQYYASDNYEKMAAKAAIREAVKKENQGIFDLKRTEAYEEEIDKLIREHPNSVMAQMYGSDFNKSTGLERQIKMEQFQGSLAAKTEYATLEIKDLLSKLVERFCSSNEAPTKPDPERVQKFVTEESLTARLKNWWASITDPTQHRPAVADMYSKDRMMEKTYNPYQQPRQSSPIRVENKQEIVLKGEMTLHNGQFTSFINDRIEDFVEAQIIDKINSPIESTRE